MQVAIRTDASFQIGSGHVMRCLALAEQMRSHDINVLFICREIAGNLNDLIASQGFALCRLPPPSGSSHSLDWNRHAAWLEVPWQKDADETAACLQQQGNIDCLLVDHYAIDKNWEQQQRLFAVKIMAIDDLADRYHDCDILLDQNLHKHPEKRYQTLLPDSCVQLIGPKYALLRPEFIELRRRLRRRDGRVRRVLFFFGGADLHDLTSKVLKAVRCMNIPQIELDVVVGGQNLHAEKVRSLCGQMYNTQYYHHVSNMGELMAAADIAVGGAGSTAWERCFLSLPSIIFSIADNQTANAKIIARCGAACYLGTGDSFDGTQFTDVFQSLLQQPERVLQMSRSASRMMDGWQGAEAIIHATRQWA